MGTIFNIVFSVLVMCSEFMGTGYAIIQLLFVQFVQS